MIKQLSLALLCGLSFVGFSQNTPIAGPDTLCASGPCSGTTYDILLPPGCTVTWAFQVPNVHSGISMIQQGSSAVISTDTTVTHTFPLMICATVQCDSTTSYRVCKTIIIPALDSSFLPQWKLFDWSLGANPAQNECSITCYSNVIPAHNSVWKLYQASYNNGQSSHGNTPIQTLAPGPTASFTNLPLDHYFVEQHVQVLEVNQHTPVTEGINLIFSRYFHDLAPQKTNSSSLQDGNSEIEFYPNPASQWLTISNTNESSDVKIYSLDGKLVRTERLAPSSRMNLSDLKSGQYVIHISTENQELRTLLIIE